MPTARTTARRNRIARGAALAVHALLLLAVLRDRDVPRDDTPGGRETRIDVTWLAAPHHPAATPRSPAAGVAAPDRRLLLAPSGAAHALSAIEAPAEPRPQVDWAREAERVARAMPGAGAAARTDCEDTDRPGAMRPRCTPRRPAFGWGHEPRPVEFSGGLPFVRLGKRCIVGLGFFGCAVGAAPEANGHLFDDRTDPDRPRSSVPDAPDGARP